MARLPGPTLASALLLLSVKGHAAVPSSVAQQLDSVLTPTGAERAGTTDGVPPWTGGIRAAATDALPFAGEQKLFSITAANFAQYAARLPEGQKALFRKYPAYRMDIYPSHRTAAAPESVYQSIRANATRAHAAPGGILFGVAGAAGGIPFPIPQNGTEAIWNHLLAYWGPARDDWARTYYIGPDGAIELTHRYHETVDLPYYYPGTTPETLGAYYLKRREISAAPADLAGHGYTAWYRLDDTAGQEQIWQYVPGERRVRKSPLLAFDTPTPDGAGLQSFDEYYIFSGSPQRYDFTMLGKAEMYVPYNNNRFTRLPIEAVAGRHHANPDTLRYELHRVWIIDATLRPGQRHLAPHRRFYLDEDTWFAVYCDAWDADGAYWKFSQATMYLMPQLPAVVLGTNLLYDLQSGGYLINFAFNGERTALSPTPPHPATTFSPETLSAESVP